MKGFGIEIKNNLLEPKHIENMGVAVWLYMWLVDKMTSVGEDGVGLVLGGRPVKFEEVRAELGISKNTYTRWIDKLVAYPYILVTVAPHGIVYKVLKAHKRFTKNQKRFTKKDEGFTINGERNIRHNKDNTKDSNSSFKKTKPFYNGHEMRFAQNKWWVIEKGIWLEYADKLSKISWVTI